MNKSLAKFSIRYSLLERPGVACVTCHCVLDRLGILAIYIEGNDCLPARAVCNACSKKLCPHLHLILENAGIIPRQISGKARGDDERNRWRPISEYAIRPEEVSAEEVRGLCSPVAVEVATEKLTQQLEMNDDDETEQ